MQFITEWRESYAKDLAYALNNLNVQNNLRDGLKGGVNVIKLNSI